MAKKLTTKEFEKVKTVYNTYMEHDRKVHEFDMLHARALKMFFDSEDALNVVRAELEDKYGSVNINLENGEIQEVVEEAEEVKE